MGGRICCKNPEVGLVKEVQNDDVVNNITKEIEKNKIKEISPYFKQFAIDSNKNKDQKVENIKNGVNDSSEEQDDEIFIPTEEEEKGERFEEKRLKEDEDLKHMNNLNSIRFGSDNQNGTKVSKIPLEVINEEHSFQKERTGGLPTANDEDGKLIEDKVKVVEMKANKSPKSPKKQLNSPKKEVKIAENAFKTKEDGQLLIDLPSPINKFKDRKESAGPYIKGNWRTLNIKSIVPANVLISKDPDELVLQGDLFKFANNAFTVRYVVLTKSELRYYKSKESFLTQQPPLGKVSMFQIDSIDKYDLKHPKKNKNSIFFKINMINLDEYGKMKGMFDKSSINSPSKSPGKRNLTTMDFRLNELDGEEDELNLNNSTNKGPSQKGKARKMGLIQDEEKNKASKSKVSQKNEEELFLIFGVESDVMADKWIFIIDYFSSDNAF